MIALALVLLAAINNCRNELLVCNISSKRLKNEHFIHAFYDYKKSKPVFFIQFDQNLSSLIRERGYSSHIIGISLYWFNNTKN